MNSNAVDIVYALGSGSQRDDAELRYSLRSVYAYAQNVRNVYVVGRRPAWLSDAAVFIKAADNKGASACNVIAKISATVERAELSEAFVFMMDDVFLTRPQDFAALPIRRRDFDLPSELKANANNWNICMRDTRRVLDAAGLTAHHYGQHAPIPITRARWNAAHAYWTLAESLPCGMSWMSVLGNLAERDGIATEVFKDCKIQEAHAPEDFAKIIGDRPHWSIGDGAVDSAINFLSEQFKAPSKFEK